MSVGDIFIQRPDMSAIFGDTADYLAGADFLFGNLEGPVSARGEPIPGKAQLGSRWLRSSLPLTGVLGDIGFSAVTVANNHVMDFGAVALADTIEACERAGVAVFGGGSTLAAATRPAVISKDGTTIASLGHTTVFPVSGYAATDTDPGLATINVSTAYQAPPQAFYQPGTPSITVTSIDPGDLRRFSADVTDARKAADLVVVQFHWGVAGYAYRLGYMRVLARCAIDAGADLIVGNHPHLLLGAEFYRGRLICYNLNHFAFDDPSPGWPGGHDALILTSTIENARFTKHSLRPAVIDPASRNLRLADPVRACEVASLLTGLSAAFGTRFETEETLIIPAAPAEPPGEALTLESSADLAPFLSEGIRLAGMQSRRDFPGAAPAEGR
jgi:poly-gamma-glutamate capsule biosynthesis protein CapA/YwtB (metallophosphatase superfamily)